MVVRDDVNYVLNYGPLPAEMVLGTLVRKPQLLHIGHEGHEKIIEIADPVTGMREIKHPCPIGIKAQYRIEF